MAQGDIDFVCATSGEHFLRLLELGPGTLEVLRRVMQSLDRVDELLQRSHGCLTDRNRLLFCQILALSFYFLSSSTE